MACGICVNLEPIGGVRIVRWFQHSRTKRDGLFMRFLEVVHMDVDVKLLLRRAIRPIGRHMVWRQLKGKSPHAIDYHAVPVIVSMDLAIQ